MTATVMALLAFVSITGLVIAAAMIFRDVRRPDQDIERRLGLALKDMPSDVFTPTREAEAGGRIDRAFVRLIREADSPLDVSTALSLVIGAAVIGCAGPLVLTENLLVAAAGMLLGAFTPVCWWSFRRARRLNAMQKGMPETLELVADSVRAGQSLERASQLVAEQGPQPLNVEFGYCASQLRLGHSPRAVLERMVRRVPLPEFKIFSTAVMVHRQTGGNLALLARRLATSARDRGEFQGHVRAVTAGHRISVIALSLGTVIAIGVLFSLQPDYLRAFVEHPSGPGLLVTAAVLQAVGLVWVWRVLKVRF